MDEREPFLQRWSRRKAGAKMPPPGAPDEVPTPAASELADQRPDAVSSRDRASGEACEPFDLSALPRVEGLTVDSDVSRFLDARVPAALRNAALRQMWSLDPTIRDFIEVAENQWNWNLAPGAPGGAPGYGPLDPGTDVAALLAQATGAIVKVAEPALGGANEADREKVIEQSGMPAGRPTSSAKHAAAQQDPPSQLSQAVSDDSVQVAIPTAHSEVEAATSAPDHLAAVQQVRVAAGPHQEVPRRRHGGALPG